MFLSLIAHKIIHSFLLQTTVDYVIIRYEYNVAENKTRIIDANLQKVKITDINTVFINKSSLKTNQNQWQQKILLH